MNCECHLRLRWLKLALPARPMQLPWPPHFVNYWCACFIDWHSSLTPFKWPRASSLMKTRCAPLRLSWFRHLSLFSAFICVLGRLVLKAARKLIRFPTARSAFVDDDRCVEIQERAAVFVHVSLRHAQHTVATCRAHLHSAIRLSGP